MLTALLLAALAQAQDPLTPLLDRGPLVLVEHAKGGKFGQATGIVQVDAPVEKVWAALLDMDAWKKFMPKVETSEVSNKNEATGEFDVRFVIEVPGPDTDYTIRFTRNDKELTLTGRWLKGDLKSSRWFWKVQKGANGKTLLSQTLAVKNFSAILQNVEDEQQTMTMGVNVASSVAATTALKKHLEGGTEKELAAKEAAGK